VHIGPDLDVTFACWLVEHHVCFGMEQVSPPLTRSTNDSARIRRHPERKFHGIVGWSAHASGIRFSRDPRDFADERTARSDSPLGAVSRSRQALATQIPNRLAERLRVGNLPSG
jgi:hypothetical protein